MSHESCPIGECPNYETVQENIRSWIKWSLTTIIILSAVHGLLAAATYRVAEQSADALSVFAERYNITDKNVAVTIANLQSETRSCEYRILLLEKNN